MKNLILISFAALLMCGWAGAYAQSSELTYSVVDDAGLKDLTPYHSALQSANLHAYRNRDSRRTLLFDNGLKIELLSVNELAEMGFPLDEEARTASDSPKREAVFSVRGGYLIEQLRPAGKGGR